jgi:hypothetical protein
MGGYFFPIFEWLMNNLFGNMVIEISGHFERACLVFEMIVPSTPIRVVCLAGFGLKSRAF